MNTLPWHQLTWEKIGANLFAADPKGLGLTVPGYPFIARILEYGRALCAVFSLTFNSYKRPVRQGDLRYLSRAPVFNSFGRNKRTNSIRVPVHGGRGEPRNVDGALNPYLAAALALATGSQGVREGLDPGDPQNGKLYDLSEEQREARGIEFLPQNLIKAVNVFASDPFMEEILGKEQRDEFSRNKVRERECYHQRVSVSDIERYSHLVS